jgi:predicted amidohydrolase
MAGKLSYQKSFSNMTNAIKIAAAASLVTPSVAENGAHLRDLMTQAREGGARLIHFPEGALSGYVKAQIFDWAAVDWRLLRAELDEMAAHARRLGLWTVLGCNHRLTPPNRPHNSLYVISDDGALVGRYDKRLCSNAEISDWYSPGFEPLVFDIDGFRFGAVLCIEIFFPDLFAEYERLGADCVLFSTYTASLAMTIAARGHAAVNNYWISLATTTQSKYDVASIIGPDGEFLAQSSSHGDSGLTFGALSRMDPRYDVPLNKARPWRAMAKQGDIYRARRVDDPHSRDRLTFLAP